MVPLTPVTRGVLFAVAAFGCFASGDAIVKFVSADLSLAQIVFVSCIGAMVPVVFMVMRQGGPRSLKPNNRPLVALRMALLGVEVFFAYFAFSRLPLANAYTLILTTPLFITALAGPMLGEFPGWRRWMAVIVGFSGVLVVLRPGMTELDPGYLGAVASAFGFAVAVVLTRRLGNSETGACLVFTAFLGRIVLSGLLLPFFWQPMTWTGFVMILAVGICSGVGHIFVWLAMRSAPASIISPFQFSQIVWGTMYGILVFGDFPDRYVMAGSAIVIGSGLYVFFREQQVKAARN